MGLVSFLQKYFTKKWLFKQEEKPNTRSLPPIIKNIGFLISLQKPEDEKRFKEIEKILKDFFNEAEEIKWIGIVKAKKQKVNLFKSTEILFKDDLNIWGQIKNFTVKKFINQPFDVLFNLTEDELPVVQIIISQSKAKYKVGRGGKKIQLYQDFMVNPSIKGNSVELLHAILDYLKIVKS